MWMLDNLFLLPAFDRFSTSAATLRSKGELLFNFFNQDGCPAEPFHR